MIRGSNQAFTMAPGHPRARITRWAFALDRSEGQGSVATASMAADGPAAASAVGRHGQCRFWLR